MFSRTKPYRFWPLTCYALVALALSACAPGTAAATPTADVGVIYTAAVQTFQAQQATQLALTPPTDTPAPSPLPTLPPLSPVPTIGLLATLPIVPSACDGAAYVADVTIPDGTVVAPGQSFEKKWRLQNTGSCTWSTSYEIVFVSGSQMGGTTPGFVKVPVPPGNQTEMSVQLTAPTTSGSYTGTWRMQNAGGAQFGSFVTVVISVGSGGTVTPGPSPTPGGGYLTISGSAGATGVTMTYSGTTSGTSVSDASGNYSISVPSGWTGTLIPSKGNPGHWLFTPASKTFTNVTSDQTFDFTAIPVTPTTEATATATP